MKNTNPKCQKIHDICRNLKERKRITQSFQQRSKEFEIIDWILIRNKISRSLNSLIFQYLFRCQNMRKNEVIYVHKIYEIFFRTDGETKESFFNHFYNSGEVSLLSLSINR